MKKCFVLSSRTLVSKRNATLGFDSDSMVVIPMAVIDELQTKYAEHFDERGKIAREVLDYLWSFDTLDLKNGVVQENGSILRICHYLDEQDNDVLGKMEVDKAQKALLQTCLYLKKSEIEYQIILISPNTSLRMRAKMMGIESQNLKDELLPEVAEQYTGRANVFASKEQIDEFYAKKSISLDSIKKLNPKIQFWENMFLVMTNDVNSALGRVKGNIILPLFYNKMQPYGVSPKNAGQRFMIEALMANWEEASLVIVKGPAGTAKTFISLACALEQVTGKDIGYQNNILISRSPTETGEKIGYLPGDEDEKMGPYMRGIYDNLAQLNSGPYFMGKEHKGKNEKPEIEDGHYFFETGVIKVEAIGYIRGRSTCDTYIIIDEAQNLTPVETKTIITRAGEGTKLILIGDPEQIDRPGLTERNNGLSYASERLKGEPWCWQITMGELESVRSHMAKRASKLL